MSVVKTIIPVFTLIGLVFAGYFHLDSRFAKAEDAQKLDKKVQKIERKISLLELQDILHLLLKDYYFYKDLQKKYPDDEEIKLKVKELDDQISDVKAQIKTLKLSESQKSQ